MIMASTIDSATLDGHKKLKHGDLDAATEYFQSALQKAYDTGDESMVKACLFNVGACHIANGKARQGLLALNQAEELEVESEEVENKADLYYNIGLANFSLCEHEKAIEAYAKAISFYKEMNNDEMQAEVNAKLGICYNHLDKPEDAIRCLKSVSETWEKLNQLEALVSSLNNLAKCLARNRNLAECGNVLRKMFHEFQNLKDNMLIAQILSDVGLIYSQENELESAHDCFYEAYQRLKRADKDNEQSHEVEGIIVQNLGAILNRQGNFKEAVKYHTLAMMAYDSSNNQPAYSRTASNLAYAYYMMKDAANAVINFKKAKLASEKCEDQEAQLLALQGLAPLYCDNGDYDNAIQTYGDILAVLSRNHQLKNDDIEDAIKNLINVTYMKAKRDIIYSSMDVQENDKNALVFGNSARHLGNQQKVLISRGLSIVENGIESSHGNNEQGSYFQTKPIVIRDGYHSDIKSSHSNKEYLNGDSVLNATATSNGSSYYEKPVDEPHLQEISIPVATSNKEMRNSSKLCVIQ